MANAWDPTGSVITLKDYAILNKGSKFGEMANMVAQVNTIMSDMPMMECNSDDGNTYSSLSLVGNPNPSPRRINQGVDKVKSDFAMTKDGCAVWESASQIDELLTMGKDSDILRLKQAPGIIEGFQQTLNKTLMYSTVDASYQGSIFKGFAPRYNSLTGTNANNVISCGGTSNDNTSVWLIVWGANTVHGIHPVATPVGLEHIDRGRQKIIDPDGREYYGYEDTWRQYAGLHLKDWRYVVRICNIDVSDLGSMSGTQNPVASNPNLLINRMRQAMDTIPQMAMGSANFYAHRSVIASLRQQCAMTKSPDFTNFVQSQEQVSKMQIGAIASGRNSFAGVPIGVVDQILLTESRVV